MSIFDGNAPEMPEHRPVDDGAIEAALAGSARGADLDALSSFVSAVRSAAEAVPTPSKAMAAVLTAGLSTEKGDLSATAASNVNGPATQEAGLSKWRKAKMKIQGFLAGLGVLGKVALGVGVAAAATTGAGAAGMLPFSMPGAHPAHHHIVVAGGSTTTTSRPAPASGGLAAGAHRSKSRIHAVSVHHAVVATTTSAPKPASPVNAPPPTVTTTTSAATPTTVLTPITETPTTQPSPAPTTTSPQPATTTTQPPPTTPPTTTGGSAPTQSIQLSCSATGATQVTCTWTAAPGFDGTYALWRWTTGGNGSDYAPIYQTRDTLTFVDNNVTPGVPYTYRVFTTLNDGTTSGPWSNKFSMSPL